MFYFVLKCYFLKDFNIQEFFPASKMSQNEILQGYFLPIKNGFLGGFSQRVWRT